MKDSTLLKSCFIIFITGIIFLAFLTKSLDNENTAIITKIHCNTKFLNMTIQTNKETLTLTAFQQTPLPVKEGDYIRFTGKIDNNIIVPNKITKMYVTTP